MANETQLTVKDVAERLGAHEETVRRWLKAGRLHGYLPGGDKLGWRIRESELERFITEREGAATSAE